MTHRPGKWSGGGSLIQARYAPHRGLTSFRKVLVAGGALEADRLTSAELYDPTTGTWEDYGHLNVSRSNFTATLAFHWPGIVRGRIQPRRQYRDRPN